MIAVHNQRIAAVDDLRCERSSISRNYVEMFAQIPRQKVPLKAVHEPMVDVRQLKSTIARRHRILFSGGDLRDGRQTAYAPAIVIAIDRVRSNPAAHHHHRHTRAGMSRAARQVQTGNVLVAIGWFKGAQVLAMTGQTVNGPAPHFIANVDIFGVN